MAIGNRPSGGLRGVGDSWALEGSTPLLERMTSAGSSSSLCATCSAHMVVILVCLSLLMSRVQEAESLSAEGQALFDFTSNLDIDNSQGYWDTWNKSDEDPCRWMGITCSANFTVLTIDLSDWGITGIFEPNDPLSPLSLLKSLQILDLSNNNLAVLSNNMGSLGNFSELTRLDFSKSNLGGLLPEGINNCQNLRYLYFQQNNLEGEIPSLHGLVNLQVLSLGYNQLKGPISQQLQDLTGLVRADLSNNMLNGTVPALPKLTSLVDLNLQNNSFTGFEDPQRPVSTSLVRLVVSGNNLQGSIPPGLTGLLELQVLDLSSNQLVGEIPADLLQSTTFNRCNLSHNRLTGEIPLNPAPLQIRGMLQYVFLDLSNNQLTGHFPNVIGPDIAVAIGQFWLHNNLLSGDIVDSLSQDNATNYLQNTEDLRLENNNFTGDLTRMTKKWPWFDSIQSWNLANNNLQILPSEECPDPMRCLMEGIMETPWLEEFRVGGNNFAGNMLPFSNYTMDRPIFLKVLDLSNSHLEGQISSDVFNKTLLPYILYLNFSNNDATGSIPGNLLQLESLEVLDMSNNHLSGVLPVIPPNSSLYNTNFFANNQLCGAPLADCTSHQSGVKWWVLVIIIVASIMLSVCSCGIAVWQWRAYSKRHQQDADLIKTLLERDSASLMPLRDLKKATDNFATSKQIGAGGFGTVYLGTLSKGVTVAIKRSKLEGTEKDKQQFLNEVKVLSHVNHRHLVKLLGCCMENKIALLVLEYVPNGTLHDHLHRKTDRMPLSWNERLRIAVQVADALNYLHSAASFPIFHRDVKSSNILLTDDLNAKVADFGISKLVPVEATHASTVAIQGTLGYLDPEYYSTCQLTAKSDVYSFGVVLLELMSAKLVLDFSRPADETSLVNFATPLIEGGDLRPLLDPMLEETYNEQLGSESILKVGRLALTCLDMRSKGRPSMATVWKELQTLFLEFEGDAVVEDDDLPMSYSRRLLWLPHIDSGKFGHSFDENA